VHAALGLRSPSTRATRRTLRHSGLASSMMLSASGSRPPSFRAPSQRVTRRGSAPAERGGTADGTAAGPTGQHMNSTPGWKEVSGRAGAHLARLLAPVADIPLRLTRSSDLFDGAVGRLDARCQTGRLARGRNRCLRMGASRPQPANWCTRSVGGPLYHHHPDERVAVEPGIPRPSSGEPNQPPPSENLGDETRATMPAARFSSSRFVSMYV